jgi:carbonic anhydrase/acetyltransferase-like protein (isoleucine patch superfamily)
VAIYALGDRVPEIDPSAYVHPDATVIGKVTIGPESTIWPQVVLRGDYGEIIIGARSSVQDGSIIHATPVLPTRIGDDCVVGHAVHLEGCTLENGSLAGSGSVVLHNAVVRSGGVVGANAVVSSNVEVPAGAMALGIPARMRLDSVPPDMIKTAAVRYVENGKRYRAELRRID